MCDYSVKLKPMSFQFRNLKIIKQNKVKVVDKLNQTVYFFDLAECCHMLSLAQLDQILYLANCKNIILLFALKEICFIKGCNKADSL